MGLIDNVNVNVGGNGNIIDTLSTYVTKLLKPNIVDGKNILTQEMMSAQNTKYVIKYDYTLAEDITVPENCVLEFNGGSISGEHTITFDSTLLSCDVKITCNIGGTIANESILIDWFIENNNYNLDKAFEILAGFIENYDYNGTIISDNQKLFPLSTKVGMPKIVFSNGIYNLTKSVIFKGKVYFEGYYSSCTIGDCNGTTIFDKRTTDLSSPLMSFMARDTYSDPANNDSVRGGCYIKNIRVIGFDHYSTSRLTPIISSLDNFKENNGLYFNNWGWESVIENIQVQGFGGYGVCLDNVFDTCIIYSSIHFCGWKKIDGSWRYPLEIINGTNAISTYKLHIEDSLRAILLNGRQNTFTSFKYEAPHYWLLFEYENDVNPLETPVIYNAFSGENVFIGCDFILQGYKKLTNTYGTAQVFYNSINDANNHVTFNSCNFVNKPSAADGVTDRLEGFRLGTMSAFATLNSCYFDGIAFNEGVKFNAENIEVNCCSFDIRMTNAEESASLSSPTGSIHLAAGRIADCEFGFVGNNKPSVNHVNNYCFIFVIDVSATPSTKRRIIDSCRTSRNTLVYNLFIIGQAVYSNPSFTFIPCNNVFAIDMANAEEGKNACRTISGSNKTYECPAFNADTICITAATEGDTLQLNRTLDNITYRFINKSAVNIKVFNYALPPNRMLTYRRIQGQNFFTLDTSNLAQSGTFSSKPTSLGLSDIGFRYFCKSGASVDGGTTEKANIAIYYIGYNNWVDANGVTVVAKS